MASSAAIVELAVVLFVEVAGVVVAVLVEEVAGALPEP